MTQNCHIFFYQDWIRINTDPDPQPWLRSWLDYSSLALGRAKQCCRSGAGYLVFFATAGEKSTGSGSNYRS